LREKYPNNNVKWLVQDLPTCQADYVMIQQVWLNLLENANKYSLPSQHPEIEVGSLQEDEQTIFFVRDNGQGFEMQYADKIFRIFHRLDHDDALDSTGVGLAIVQRILQRHGGKIWTNSQPRQGATFFFSLP
jgi:light-regulated signal transduction histidine kinase (bacteriophytochrome)